MELNEEIPPKYESYSNMQQSYGNTLDEPVKETIVK
jgi:hypothetical protein